MDPHLHRVRLRAAGRNLGTLREREAIALGASSCETQRERLVDLARDVGARLLRHVPPVLEQLPLYFFTIVVVSLVRVTLSDAVDHLNALGVASLIKGCISTS